MVRKTDSLAPGGSDATTQHAGSGDAVDSTPASFNDPLSLFPPEDAESVRRLIDATRLRPDHQATLFQTAQQLTNFDAPLDQTECARASSDERLTSRLSALEARIVHLTEDDGALEHANRKVAQLKQRVTDTINVLERGRKDFAAKTTSLDHRLAAAAAELKQATNAKCVLERELEHLHNELKRVTRSAHNRARELDTPRQAADQERLRQPLKPRAITSMAAVIAEDIRARRWPVLDHRRTVVGIVVALLVAFVAMRTFQRPTRMAVEMKVESNSALTSRTLTFAPLPLYAPPPTADVGEPPLSLQSEQWSPPRTAVAMPARVSQDASAAVSSTTTTQLDKQRETGAVVDPEFTGTVAVESDPVGATVLINQRPVGETPVILTLRPGSYVLWIERAGFQRWTAAVAASAVRDTHISATLQPESTR